MRFSDDLTSDWNKLESYFRGFFMKAVIGYSPQLENRQFYPFQTFRSRHAAVAKLESEGLFMGNDAQCKSKSKPTTN
jgi:hypothetical protein